MHEIEGSEHAADNQSRLENDAGDFLNIRYDVEDEELVHGFISFTVLSYLCSAFIPSPIMNLGGKKSR